jgi:CheY-like chemotaxis protein
VLVAEDNIVNQRVVLTQLKRIGFTADAVANGREALDALRRAPYDIILMDCQMPEIDGYEAAARIRAEGLRTFKSEPYLIALTANALPGDRERCFAAGMNDYVSKQVRLNELQAALVRGIEFIEKKSAPSFESESELVDREVIRGLADLGAEEDANLVAELIDLFLMDAPALLGALMQAAAYAAERGYGLYEAVDVFVPDVPESAPPGMRLVIPDRKRLDRALRARLEEASRPPKEPGMLARLFRRGNAPRPREPAADRRWRGMNDVTPPPEPRPAPPDAEREGRP